MEELLKMQFHILILKNGKAIASTQNTSYNTDRLSTSEYQVIAIDKNKIESFASEPILVTR